MPVTLCGAATHCDILCSDKVSKEENEHKRMEKLIRKKGLKERELLTWQLQTANEKIAEQNKREKVRAACSSS